MMQQLFIDGILADTNENTEVNLTVVSNLLKGAADFSGNRSLTITLPSTAHNQSIIKHADRVPGGKAMPYEFHSVDYYRNGVLIISGGKGRLLSTTPTEIQIAVTWGVRVAVEAMLTSGDTLNDIETDAAITFNAQPSVSTYADAQTDEVFYASLDCVRHESENEYYRMHVIMGDRVWDFNDLQPASSYLHPSVRMDWILAKLQTRYGMTFDWGTAASEITPLIVPLINKYPNDTTFNGGYRAGMSEPGTWGTGGDGTIRFTTSNSSAILADVSGATQIFCLQSFGGMLRFSIVLYITENDLVPIASPICKLNYGYRLYVRTRTTVRYCTLIPEGTIINSHELNSAGQLPIYVTGVLPIDMEYDADNNDFLSMFVGCVYNGVFDNTLDVELHLTGGSITVYEITADDNAVQPSQLYPVAGNLPEIKPIDLVKFLCAITGTFPVQASTESTLIMRPVSSLFDWSRAVNWSGRLLSVTDRSVASNNEYTVDDWAQRNWWRWKEDETVYGDYDGSIDVDNATLEASRDILTFPFAATDGNNLPMYTTENNTAKWNKIEPRVLRMYEGDNSEALAIFDMNMATVINDHYNDLTETMQRPKVIRETIRISNVELKNIDETRPIYIRQHGAYFALLELTDKADGTAEVKLLRLTKAQEA